MSLGNMQKGYYRDQQIVELILKNKVMNTEQIKAMLFNSKQGERIAQRRLKVLADKKIIKRDRFSLATPYYYFVKKTGQLNHSLNISWIYVWLNKTLKSWEKLYTFDHEQDFGILRCDALAGIKNATSKELNLYFIEMDQADSNKAFKKIKLYNDLFEIRHSLNVWWKNLTTDFPSIIIVTTKDSQIRLIEQKIEKDNRHNLNFGVYHIDQIKGECGYGP